MSASAATPILERIAPFAIVAAVLPWSCVHTSEVKGRVQIQCNLIKISDALSLEPGALPAAGLTLKNAGDQIQNYREFQALISAFNESGERLIDEIFFPLIPARLHEVNVVATHGIPEPYDAWTAVFRGRTSFFFNLDLWSKETLQRSGLGVIKHEATHVLLADILKAPNEADPISVLDEIVINEGIAHFVGYTKDRRALLIDKRSEWIAAEASLDAATSKLMDPSTPDSVRKDLLKKANTGRFWEKYGAIAGMFRAAEIYNKQGAAGLIEAIKRGRLPKQAIHQESSK